MIYTTKEIHDAIQYVGEFSDDYMKFTNLNKALDVACAKAFAYEIEDCIEIDIIRSVYIDIDTYGAALYLPRRRNRNKKKVILVRNKRDD